MCISPTTVETEENSFSPQGICSKATVKKNQAVSLS